MSAQLLEWCQGHMNNSKICHEGSKDQGLGCRHREFLRRVVKDTPLETASQQEDIAGVPKRI